MRNGPQPSRRAASYTSVGTRRQAQYRMRTKNGLVPDRAGNMSAQSVSSTPSDLKIKKRGSHSDMVGTSSRPTAAVTRIVRGFGGNSAMASAAQDAQSSVNGTASATTITELRAYRPNGSSEKMIG